MNTETQKIRSSSSLRTRVFQTILERSPPGQILPVCLGIAAAPSAFLGSFHPVSFILGIIFTYSLLVQMRLGDEIKDYPKDITINPNRPLPRGLLKVSEAKKSLQAILTLHLTSGLLISVAFPLAGIGLILSALYVHLMYKEFYVGTFLAKDPMVYAVSHQIVIYGVYGWVGAFLGIDFIAQPEFLAWLTANLGASFAFEISRKLNPSAHALAGTYLHHYGPGITWTAIMSMIILSLASASLGGFFAWTGPFLIMYALSTLLLFLKPDRYKVIEGMGILSATAHLLFPLIRWIATQGAAL